jgi:hypothetical protein
VKKGALVRLVMVGGVPVPNVVIFQFNPESIRHSWSQGMAAGAEGTPARTTSSPLAASGPPQESFSFSISLDVTDQLADPSVPVRLVARQSGLYPRLAALELLLHPNPIGALTAAGGRTTPAAELPVVLFVWGSTRIVPVRVTSLSITEKLYDADLNPTHAEAALELHVLTADDLRSVTGPSGALATAAYTYTQGGRLALAVANIGVVTQDVIGMLADKRLIP